MASAADGIAYMNGTYCPLGEASVPLLDPGFTRGDAVYDTVSVWGGQFFRLDDHVARFFRSCATARLAPPATPDELKAILAQCVHRSGLDAAYVQMISTRGKFQSPTVRDPRLCKNTLMTFAMPYIWIIPPARQLEGIDLAVAKGNRRTPPEAVDPRMKNFNWLDLQRGLFEGLDRGSDTSVLCTPDGRLSEGPGFNLFVVGDDVLRTPRGNVLEGITRSTILELAGDLGLKAEEADLTADDLHTADEAFLSSTAGGVMPVATVDGVPLRHGDGPGPISLRLRSEYWARREAGWLGTPVASLLVD
ncbi:MAG: aminotransferase class IV [Ilumatobacteraceae bacterium]